MDNYEKQGQDFLERTGTKFKANLLYHDKYFPDDKESRDIYQITLTRGDRVWSFRFGQSLANSNTEERKREIEQVGFWTKEGKRLRAEIKSPSAYDVLACITKHDPGTLQDFCNDYGYDIDSKKAEKIYFDVQHEWENVRYIFDDVLSELAEIN